MLQLWKKKCSDEPIMFWEWLWFSPSENESVVIRWIVIRWLVIRPMVIPLLQYISVMGTKAKCLHLKKLTCKGTLRQVFICLRPPPLLGFCLGWVEPERRLGGQQFTKLGRKYQHDWIYLQSINSDKYLSQSPFTVQFLDDDISLWCLRKVVTMQSNKMNDKDHQKILNI